MMLLASLTLAGCLTVAPDADRIVARDLAPAFPAIAEALSGTVVALAPAPGVRRLFGLAELGRMAARLSIPAPPGRELCFERPVSPLDAARMLEAMRESLPGARIEVLDFSRRGAPEGRIEFPRGGLRRTPGGAYWNGFVRYAGTRRFLIWAKVAVVVAAPCVVAVDDLPAGKPVEAARLRVERREEFPARTRMAGSLEEVSGRVLRRAVSAGTAIRAEWLEPLRDVRRGDTVRVEVRSGSARLELEGQAQGSGTAGETIWVLNPESRKRFQARVEAKGKVAVERGGR